MQLQIVLLTGKNVVMRLAVNRSKDRLVLLYVVSGQLIEHELPHALTGKPGKFVSLSGTPGDATVQPPFMTPLVRIGFEHINISTSNTISRSVARWKTCEITSLQTQLLRRDESCKAGWGFGGIGANLILHTVRRRVYLSA